MEVEQVKSTQFTKLNATTKDLINMGEWFLYRIADSGADYYLSTDGMSYYLTKDGGIVGKTPRTPEGLEFLSRITFDDIPCHVMRNVSVTWA